MIYSFNLNSSVILITGGYGYLGKAISESLAYHGAKVYVLGKDDHKFNSAFPSAEIGSNSAIKFQYCDVSDSESIQGAIRAVYDENGSVDVLVNNAFYSEGRSPENMSDVEWSTGIDGTLSSV